MRPDLLKGRIQELRTVLHDNPRHPRFIETVPRRGYRWIAPIALQAGTQSNVTVSEIAAPLAPTHCVGRAATVAHLQQSYQRALEGTRQVTFISGDVGIGKTTVVQEFLKQLRSRVSCWVGIGQCVEYYGGEESYLPIREVLGRLAQRAEGDRFVRVLRRFAPGWLAQLSFATDPAERDWPHRELQNATPHRLLVQFTEAVEAFCVDEPLILVFEDLQWSDLSTIDVFSMLANRTDPARLFLLLTYRTGTLAKNSVAVERLITELALHQRCERIHLPPLSEPEVCEYLERRWPVNALSPSRVRELARVLYARTEGNPLFLVNVVNYLVAKTNLLKEAHAENPVPSGIDSTEVVPASLRVIVERQIAALSVDEQKILHVASVAGVEFSTTEVAAGVGHAQERVETICRSLTRQHRGGWFIPSGPGRQPHGARAEYYRFSHAFYQNVIYDSLSTVFAAQTHLRIRTWLEAASSEQILDLALALAHHFEKGHNCEAALRHLLNIVTITLACHAYQEVVALATKGGSLLGEISNPRVRSQHELALRMALGVALVTTKGYTAPEVRQTYERARVLSQHVGTVAQSTATLRGLSAFYFGRGDFQTAVEITNQLLQLTRKQKDKELLLEAYQDLGSALFSLGKLEPARRYLAKGIKIVALSSPQSHINLTGQDVTVSCLCRAAQVLWFLGYVDQALAKGQEAVARARQLGHPHSIAYAYTFQAHLYQLRGEAPETAASKLVTLQWAADYGLPTNSRIEMTIRRAFWLFIRRCFC